MLKLKSITLKNFLSIGNVTQAINLDDHGLSLVLGNNNDANGGTTKNGAGKAQPLDSKILTKQGWKTMGDMTVGEILRTPSGRFAKVKSVHPQGEVDIYKIKFSDGRLVECCKDHLWKVWINTSGWEYQVIDTNKLVYYLNNMRSSIYVPLIDHIEENERYNKISRIDTRTLGLYLGDRSPSNKKEFIKQYKELLKTPSIGYLPDIIEGLLLDDKNAFIPRMYLEASYQQRIDLLQGLVDSNGNVSRGGIITYTTDSQQLANDVQELVWSLGGIAKKTEASETNDGKSYNIYIRMNNSKNMVLPDNKKSEISELGLKIVSAEYIGKKEAQCITVDDPDHLYITDNYVVTHNTAMLQALSYGLYGQPLTKIKLDNLINNINQKGMIVTVDFEIGDRQYRIERGRRPNILKFYVNGEEIIDDIQSVENNARGENSETQVDIGEIIGMSHNMFTHIVALNTYTLPFLKLPVGKQREVSEELLGVTQISSRAETLKKLMMETKEVLRDETSRITAIKEANRRIENAIEQAIIKKDNWQRDHGDAVSKYEEQINELKNIDFEQEKKKFDQLEAWEMHQRDMNGKIELLNTQLIHTQSDLSRYKSDLKLMMNKPSTDSRILRLRQDLGDKKVDISDIDNDIILIEEKLENKQTEIDSPDDHACSTCDQKLTGTEHLKSVMDNLHSQKDNLIKRLDKANNKKEAIVSQMKQIEQEISTEEDKAESDRSEIERNKADIESKITPLEEEEIKLLKDIENLRDVISSDDDKPDLLFDNREELYSTIHALEACETELESEKNKDNPHIQHIDSLTETLQKISYDTLEKYEDLYIHQDFLFKLLTGKDSFIRKKIIEQNLHYLNVRLDHYLNKLGLPHQVVFQNDLTVDISLLGKDYDFDQLSRGEQNRVILSVSWAFRDVWESLNHTINLMFVDEMADSGIDSTGAEATLSILKHMGREGRKNVFLVSHRDELVGRIDNVITISKTDGFTTIGGELQ